MYQDSTQNNLEGRRNSAHLSAVLASPALAGLVTYFAIHSQTEVHFQALKRATGLANRSLQLELQRMQQMGLLTRREDGRYTYYKAVSDSERWYSLRMLIRNFANPAEVLRMAIANVPGIDAAFVFGSTVRGDTREDSDVDLFVVGDVDRDKLAGETMEVSALLNREVNVVNYTWIRMAERMQSGTRFIRQVLRNTKAWVVGDESVLESYTKEYA